MKQGWSAAVVAAVAVVAVFIAAWLLWPRPATVTAPRARQYLDASACLLTGSTAAGPAAVPPNTAVVSAADASERIDQEVTALAGAA